MAKGMMEDEMAGIGMPPEEDTAEMPTEEPMADEMPAEEGASSLTSGMLAENYSAMEPEEQAAVGELFVGPAASIMKKLLGNEIVDAFASQVELPSEQPAEAPEEGLMTSTATTEPVPAMASGGLLNKQARDLRSQGMSPKEIRSSIN